MKATKEQLNDITTKLWANVTWTPEREARFDAWLATLDREAAASILERLYDGEAEQVWDESQAEPVRWAVEWETFNRNTDAVQGEAVTYCDGPTRVSVEECFNAETLAGEHFGNLTERERRSRYSAFTMGYFYGDDYYGVEEIREYRIHEDDEVDE